MKLLFLSCLLPALLPGAELKDVKSVYLYPMASGLDQHLAHSITQNHIFRVVADPKLADAVFTDQLGALLEYRLDHVKRGIPAGAPAAPPPPQGSAPAATTGAAAVAATSAGGTTVSGTKAAESEPRVSSFSRGKGTVFLVDAKSKEVVWSEYRRPKNTSPRELENTAKRLTLSIEKTLAPAPGIQK